MGKIDLDKKPVQPEIFLAKPNRKIIAKLTEAHNIVFTSRLGSLNELTFDIPYEREIHHQIKRNPNVDHLRHRYLLKFVKGNYEEWFIIDAPTGVMNEKEDVKQIHAFSLGYELADKNVREYKEISKSATAVLLDALRGTIWNVGYVDAEFDLKFRSFEIASTTVLDFVYEIAKTFNVLIVWGTKNRQINLYKHENLGNNKGLKFSYGRYLKTLEKEIQPDEMVTRLKVFGKDNLSIQRVNPTGTNYIENFGYFMFPFYRDEKRNVVSHSHYMSDELCHAILDYVKLIDDHKDEFKEYLTEKEGHQKTLLAEKTTLVKLENELQVILDNLFVAQTTLQPDEFYQAQKVSKLQDISNQTAVIKRIEDLISNVDAKINTLKDKISVEKNFTPELIKERNQYIIEKEWVNEQIIDDKDLYDAGIKVFEEFAKPKTVINMDVLNFFEIIEEQRNWDKLNLGDIVTIQYEKLDVNVTAKITEMEFNFEDANIKLTIANVNDIETNEDKFIKSLYKSISTSTKVDMSKYKWDKYEHDLGDVSKIIQNMYDYVKDQLTMAFNETVIIDRSGITIRDPNDPLTYLRATHGCLAITNDGGNTYAHAITGKGVIKEKIIMKKVKR
ncbi:phage tail spike protein [Brevibacillus laterosporus]|uniref:phage tail spike protein n=1 Tax=Brevibacillus laterosporus TaxID=1465 RepID=UPI003D1B9B5D